MDIWGLTIIRMSDPLGPRPSCVRPASVTLVRSVWMTLLWLYKKLMNAVIYQKRNMTAAGMWRSCAKLYSGCRCRHHQDCDGGLYQAAFTHGRLGVRRYHPKSTVNAIFFCFRLLICKCGFVDRLHRMEQLRPSLSAIILPSINPINDGL